MRRAPSTSLLRIWQSGRMMFGLMPTTNVMQMRLSRYQTQRRIGSSSLPERRAVGACSLLGFNVESGVQHNNRQSSYLVCFESLLPDNS